MLENDAVQLETGRKRLDTVAVRLLNDHVAHAVALQKCGSHRIAQATERLLVIGSFRPVDHDPQVGASGVIVRLRDNILDKKRLSVDIKPLQALLDQQRQFLDQSLSFGRFQRSSDQHAGSGRQRGDVVDYVGHRMRTYLASRHRRIGTPDTAEQQFQVVVNFGRRTDRRSRIARIDLLLDGDGRRDPRNEIDVRLVDLTQKLPRIGRQALDVAPLPLGENGVERERGFARSRQSRNDNQLIVRNFNLDILQIVHPRAFDMNIFFLFRILHSKKINR